jgi:hypothetical protein
MSCKYHRHANQQEERIRHLEHELEVAREEIRVLRAGNVSSSIREQNNSESWCEPKNSKSRCRRFSVDDAIVKLRNRFSVLKTDTVDVGQHNQIGLKHESKKIKSVLEKISSKNKILLLGSSHAREVGPMLKDSVGKRFDIVSIVKPNAALTNAAEDLSKLGKDCTTKDHIVIVGGPGNSLDRNYNYLIEKDINFIAEKTTNTNARPHHSSSG